MKKTIARSLLSGAAITGALFAAQCTASEDNVQTAESVCNAMLQSTLPDVTITSAEIVPEPVAHCLVTGVVGQDINFSVWLPEDWNGKFVMGGQGGFAGALESQANSMFGALAKGYASAGTDTGHQGTVAGGEWALGDMEGIVNYGHLASHRVTVTAKALVSEYYAREPQQSYFAGCSNGGRQALMAAQRYPEDFDGILVGAPVVDFFGVAAADAFVTAKMYPDPNDLTAPILGEADRLALKDAVLAACDGDDGLKDGILSDPQSCTFDAAALACTSGNEDGCLDPAELEAVRAIVEGPRQKGETYHVPFPFGSEGYEAGWGRWMTGGKDMIAPGVPSLFYGFGVGFMKYFVSQDADWDYTRMDLAQLKAASAFTHDTVSPTDPDLDAFRQSGGKMLIYHGWLDSALSPLMTIDYVEEVYERDPTAAEDVRLFMLPGVQHCFGGPGPDQIDYLSVLDSWTTQGVAPDELEAGFPDGGARKVCAYPQQGVFSGSGDGRTADQFTCRANISEPTL